MATGKENGKLAGQRSPVADFLSGGGASPLPEGKRAKPGRLEAAFVEKVEADVVAQDRENSERAEPNAFEELIAALGLINGNREMLEIIGNGECSGVPDLAKRMNRGLSDVSCAISRLSGYGIVGLVGEAGEQKRPVLLMKLPNGLIGHGRLGACLLRGARVEEWRTGRRGGGPVGGGGAGRGV